MTSSATTVSPGYSHALGPLKMCDYKEGVTIEKELCMGNSTLVPQKAVTGGCDYNQCDYN